MNEQRPGEFPLCKIVLVTLILLIASLPTAAQTLSKRNVPTKYLPVSEYDAKRDAAEDISNALKEAQRTNRHVLMEVGGEWCSWCHTLDKCFQANPGLLRLRDKNFVTVKINFSTENKNQEGLSHYPPIAGYPHIFFLDSQGKLLFSQNTSVLESGRSYDLEKLTVVLTNFGPHNE